MGHRSNSFDISFNFEMGNSINHHSKMEMEKGRRAKRLQKTI